MNPLEWKELSRSTVYDGRIFTAETVVRESYDPLDSGVPSRNS